MGEHEFYCTFYSFTLLFNNIVLYQQNSAVITFAYNSPILPVVTTFYTAPPTLFLLALAAHPMWLVSYLDKVHWHKPYEVSVSGELLEVLSNSDRFFWVGMWSLANSQPGTQEKKTWEAWDRRGITTQSKNNSTKLLRVFSKAFIILTLWASVPHPVLGRPLFENDSATTWTLWKSPRQKKLPVSHRTDEKSRNPPCPRNSRTEKLRMSPKRWTLSSESWGVCDR